MRSTEAVPRCEAIRITAEAQRRECACRTDAGALHVFLPQRRALLLYSGEQKR
jgi:hypothetical protein